MGYPLDDSWIHQVFAKNLVSGNGFSINPGVTSTAATAPLWTLIMALLWKISGPIASGIIIGLILEFIALIAIYKLTHMITLKEDLALFVTVGSVVCWPVVWGGLSGMEPGLFSALSLWGLYYYFKSKSQNEVSHYLSYILFSLAFLARPECALFIAAAFLRDFVVWIKDKDKNYLPWAIRIAIILIFVVPYFVFNYNVSGTLLPPTYGAKVLDNVIFTAISEGIFIAIIKSLIMYPYFYLQHFFRKIPNLNPIIFFGFLAGIFKLLFVKGDQHSKRVMLAVLIILYTPLMGAVSPIYSAVWQFYRYVTNLLPILVMLGALGFIWQSEINNRSFKKPFIITGSICIVVGMIVYMYFGNIAETIIPLIFPETTLDTPEGIESYEALVHGLSKVGYGTAVIGVYLFSTIALTSEFWNRLIGNRNIRLSIMAIVLLIGTFITVKNGGTYADGVRNINECDVYAGKYLGTIAKPGDVVAINDVGAISYYSNMEIFDLWGLGSPEMTSEMINDDSLAFEFMKKEKQVDYLAIFPSYFKYISSRTDIFVPITQFETDYNVVLAESVTVVYKSNWPDSTSQNYQELK
jgi:hypothetical protein